MRINKITENETLLLGWISCLEFKGLKVRRSASLYFIYIFKFQSFRSDKSDTVDDAWELDYQIVRPTSWIIILI